MDNLLAGLDVADTAIDGTLLLDTGIAPTQFYSARRDAVKWSPLTN
jgi:hypothetical protein